MYKKLFYLLVIKLLVCVVFRTHIVHAEELTTASSSSLFGAEEMIYTTSATASPPTIHRGK